MADRWLTPMFWSPMPQISTWEPRAEGSDVVIERQHIIGKRRLLYVVHEGCREIDWGGWYERSCTKACRHTRELLWITAERTEGRGRDARNIDWCRTLPTSQKERRNTSIISDTGCGNEGNYWLWCVGIAVQITYRPPSGTSLGK